MPSLRFIVGLLLLPAIALAEPLAVTVRDAGTLLPLAGARVAIGGRVLVTDDAGQAVVGDLACPIAILVEGPATNAAATRSALARPRSCCCSGPTRRVR